MSAPALRQALAGAASNRVRTAPAVTASSVAPVAGSARPLPTAREGTAVVLIEGDYAGHVDTLVELEYVDDAGAVRPGAPAFVGVGNGSLEVTSAAQAETLTLTCVEAGAAAQAARAALAGVEIVARNVGTAGNAIALTVDRSALVRSASAFSVLERIPRGTQKLASAGLYFGQPVMTGDALPENALRIAFGDTDPTVYRSARRWTGGAWEYVFEPALERDIAAGEAVWLITGSYTVTLTDGTTTETYAGVTTAYDLLSRLRSESALVTVEGVVAPDRSPGGMAAREFSLRTDAHHLPPRGEGSEAARAARLEEITVGPAAATELIEARCFAATARDHPNARLGHELWQVSGSVSGAIGVFATGDRVAKPGAFAFRIQPVYPPGFGSGPRGRASVLGIQYAPRPAGQEEPPICVESFVLGPSAIDQQITLVYTKRPSGTCACEGMPAPDLSRRRCLTGEDPTEGDLMDYPATIAARMAALWAWRRDTVAAWTEDYTLKEYVPNWQFMQKDAVPRLDEIVAMLEETAVRIADHPAALAAWDAVFADWQTYIERVFSPPALSGTVVAAEAIPAGRFVYVADGVVALASRRQYFVLCNGFAASAIAAGASVDASSLSLPETVSSFTGLVRGESYFISESTPGDIEPYSSASPASPQAIGIALTSSVLDVNTYRSSNRELLPERARAQCDALLAAAGLSPLGKDDASVVSGDGCWRDREGAFYWAVTGSEGGAYLPAFTGVPYFSSRRVGGAAVGTREFAFQINVKCADKLKPGDTIRLAIGDAAWPATYQVGDSIVLPLVAAEPLALSGGQAADPIQRWSVEGSLSGPLPEWSAPESTGSYSHPAFAFTMTGGSTRFAAGDRFTVTAAGARVRWRRDGASWSAPVDAAAPIALGDGISARFVLGNGRAFVSGDRWAMAVAQPHSSEHVRRGGPMRWRWSGASATLDVDFGSTVPIEIVVAALLRLGPGATLSVRLGSTPGGDDVLSDTTLSRGHSAAALMLPAALAARYMRLGVSGEGEIGWLYAGTPVRPALSADTVLRREYTIARGAGGLNPRGALLGAGVSAQISWSEGALSDDEVEKILAEIDTVKRMGDEPVIWIAQPARAGEAVVGRVVDDSLRLEDITAYRATDAQARRWSLSLELAGVQQ